MLILMEVKPEAMSTDIHLGLQAYLKIGTGQLQSCSTRGNS